MINEILFTCAWKGTALLLGAWIASALLRKHSAAVRRLIWTASFLCLLALPAGSRLTPVWSVPLPPATRIAPAVSAPIVNAAPAPSAADWISAFWLAGAILVLGRFAAGTAKVWLKVRRARPFPSVVG